MMDLERIDILVATKVMGYHVYESIEDEKPCVILPDADSRFPNYVKGTWKPLNTPLWEIVAAMRGKGYWLSLEQDFPNVGSDDWEAHFQHHEKAGGIGIAHAPNLAVKLAALDALGVEIEEVPGE